MRRSVTRASRRPSNGCVRQEDVGGAVAEVLVVDDARRVSGTGFDRHGHMIDQLLAGLIETYQRPFRIGRTLMDVQGFLHLADELGVGLGRDDVLRDSPRLQFVFLVHPGNAC